MVGRAAPQPSAAARRIAIVTPYCGEDRTVIERCMASVAEQTASCSHILIADGRPQDWIDATGVRQVRLDQTHGDFGNVARGIGALLVAGEGFDAIGFLDADNWLEPDHVARCMAAAIASDPPCDYVIARRRFVWPDASPMDATDDPEMVDTNCLMLLPHAFPAISYWVLMPKPLAVIGDRVMHAVLQSQSLAACRLDHPTVVYTSNWACHYRAAGREPPSTAKDVDVSAIITWLEQLTPEQHRIAERLAGVAIGFTRSP